MSHFWSGVSLIVVCTAAVSGICYLLIDMIDRPQWPDPDEQEKEGAD